MLNTYLKKSLIYFLGIILIALGISLNQQHGFGQSPFDQINSVLADIFSISLGTMIMIMNLSWLALYFLIKRNKDFWVVLLAILLLGNAVTFISNTLFSNLAFYNDSIGLRILVAFLTINVLLIGVTLLIKSGLSPFPFDLMNMLLKDTVFKNMNFGLIRMMMDFTLVGIALLFNFLFLPFVYFSNYIFPVILVLTGGPLINFYLGLYDKLFKKIT